MGKKKNNKGRIRIPSMDGTKIVRYDECDRKEYLEKGVSTLRKKVLIEMAKFHKSDKDIIDILNKTGDFLTLSYYLAVNYNDFKPGSKEREVATQYLDTLRDAFVTLGAYADAVYASIEPNFRYYRGLDEELYRAIDKNLVKDLEKMIAQTEPNNGLYL